MRDETDTTRYAGPMLEFYNNKMYYSIDAMVRVEMNAPLRWLYENRNQEFPKGINIDAFDEYGKRKVNMIADYSYWEETTQIVRMEGHVVVNNYEEKQTLETPRLFWDRKQKEIYSDTIVRVTSESAKLYGIGLRAKDDFSRYKILEPTGPIRLAEDDSVGIADVKKDNDR